MTNTKSVICVALAIGLLLSNGLWFVGYQQVQGSERELLLEVDAANYEREELDIQIAALQGQNRLISDQLADLEESLLSSQESYSSLYEVYTTISELYSSLQGTYEELNQQYISLQGEHSDLEVDYASLEASYSNLYTSYSNLLAGLDDLDDDLAYYKLVNLDSLAHDYYETLREKKTPLYPSWQQNVNFMSYMSMHDRGAYHWSDLDSTYYSYHSTYRYSEARQTLISVLGYAGVTSSDTSVQKITKILAFVNDKVDYDYDMRERFFTPTETLSSGTGDCEDYSILVSSLFELAGIQSAVAGFTNSAGAGHAMVLVRLSSLGGYGHYYYDSLTGYGLSSGKWIMIEPQATIAYQQQSSWFEQWGLEAAAET